MSECIWLNEFWKVTKECSEIEEPFDTENLDWDLKKEYLYFKEKNWKVLIDLKNETIEHKKIIEMLQKELDEIPKFFKQSLLQWKTIHDVKIKIIPRKESYSKTAIGYYDPWVDTIFIPDDYIKNTKNDPWSTLMHELWHSFMDNFRKNDFLKHPTNSYDSEYRKDFNEWTSPYYFDKVDWPTVEEIDEFVKKKFKEPGFYLLKNDLFKDIYDKRDKQIEIASLKVDNIVDKIDKWMDIATIEMKKKLYDKDINREDYSNFVSLKINIMQKVSDFRWILIKLKLSKDSSMDNWLFNLRFYWIELINDLNKLSSYSISNYDLHFEWLSNWIDETIYSLKRDLISSEEVMARIVDSLVSWYNWKIIQNNYPLTEGDLEFLSRFKYSDEKIWFFNKWEEIFWEHIVKYRSNYLN